MDSEPDNNETQKIDVENVLFSKNPALVKKLVPGFVINYLKRIVHQDELNDISGKMGSSERC